MPSQIPMKGFLASAPAGTVVSSMAEMTNPYLCIGRSHAVTGLMRYGEYAVFLPYSRILGLGVRPKSGDGDPPVRQAAYAVIVPGRFTEHDPGAIGRHIQGRGPRVVLRQGGPET